MDIKNILKQLKKDLPNNHNLSINALREKFNINISQARNIKFLLNNLNTVLQKEDPSLNDFLKINSLNSKIAQQSKLIKELKENSLNLQEAITYLTDTQIPIHEFQEQKPVIIKRGVNEKENGIAIACYSDQHIGKIVTKSETNGWNEHNPDIAIKRFDNFNIGVVDEIKKTNLLYNSKGKKIETLFLAYLGDGIQGRLREEDLETNAMHPTQESILYQELLIKSIRYIAENSGIEDIYVILIWGNHGRTSQKLKFSAGWSNSYEFLTYQQVEKAFNNYISGYNNVKFLVPKSGIQEVLLYPDFPVTFSHGFHFNYAGGITGVETPMHRWHYMKQETIPAKRRYIGHWHIYKSGMVSVVGCGLGYDGFALHHNFNPEPPAGLFDIITINKGYSFNKKIRVDELLR